MSSFSKHFFNVIVFKMKEKKKLVFKAFAIDLCFFFWFHTCTDWREWFGFIAGHVGGAERQRWSICCEGLKEGCHPPGWWRGLHDDREEDFGAGAETPVPNPTLLLLSDQGMAKKKMAGCHLGAVLYDGMASWRQI